MLGHNRSTSFIKLFSSLSSNTIFNDCVVPYKNLLAGLQVSSSRLFGFETPLNQGKCDPDMALCFTKDDFIFFADWCDSLIPYSDSRSFWSRIKDIAIGKENLLRDHLNLIWIEMDYSTVSFSEFSEPALFLEFLKDNLDPDFVCRHIIPLLTENKHHPSCAKIESCLALLPVEGHLVHLGYFPARSEEIIRITLSFNHYHNIALYCSRVFEKELNKEILTRIKEFSQLSDYAVLHLDIGAEIEPKIGIEMRFWENEQNPEYQWRWRDVFSRLVDRGLCSSKEAEALLGFSGITRYIDDSTLSPSWYKYFLYYIKGVFDFSGREDYKAYCAFRRLEPSE